MRTPMIVLGICVFATTGNAQGFTLKSTDLASGRTVPMAQVFNQDGCKGQNRSPELSWSGAPAGTKSFAITMFDPDAPTGSGWWHWTLFNIPANITALPANAGSEHAPALPHGAVQGRNDYGFSAYGGPCPPAGNKPHRYFITVWALKIDKLPLSANSPGAQVGFMVNASNLAKTEIITTYGR